MGDVIKASPLSLYKEKRMSTRRQRQILRNRKLEFERKVEENRQEAKKVKPAKKKPAKKKEK